MDTSTTRVTREQAAAAAGVSPRTINRWSARGWIQVWRRGWREPAEYDLREVMARAGRSEELKGLLSGEVDSPG